MNCSMCGAIIPTGQTNCPMCGAPVQAAQQPMDAQPVNPQPVNPQPMNPQMGYGQPVNPQPMNPQMGYGQPVNPQPMNPQMGYGQPVNPQPMNPQMGYSQPMGGQPVNPQAGGYYQPKSTGADTYVAGMNGFVNSLKGNVMNIVKLAAAFILFISVFFPWVKVEFWGLKETSNLLGSGGFSAFCGWMIMLFSLVLIAWEIADYIPALANVKAKTTSIPYFELILLGVTFLFVLLGTIFVTHISGDDYGLSEYLKRSVGEVFAFIAIIAAIAPRVLDMMGIQIGKK